MHNNPLVKRKVHFIGIGGIGMSALARWFLAARKAANPERSRRTAHSANSGRAIKWLVSGSDLVSSGITKELAKEGVKVKIGHKKGNLPADARLVVYNRAIPAYNPELLAARKFGLRTLPYAEVLGSITRKYKTIAITGSHGKSTTTALAGLMLLKNKYDPTILVGTNLKELGGKNVRVGHGSYLVLEADDFGGAFLHYSPTVALITNIDKEHLDFYGSFRQLKNAFVKFIARVKLGGTLILNRDDKCLFSLRARIAKITRRNHLQVIWYSLHDREATKINKVLKISGEHNISNALAAYHLGRVLKIPEKKILKSISGYRGAWRRMEYRGTCLMSYVSCLVYDDYAHHPTEIKATLQAFKEKFPKSKIICVFQPHQAERMRTLFKDFVRAFDDADVLIILPIYKVPGRDHNADRRRLHADTRGGLNSQKLAAVIKKEYLQKSVFYLSDPKKVKSFIKNFLRRSAFSPHKSAIVVMMGAGDIVNYTSDLIH